MKIFFEYLQRRSRKLTANDPNQENFIIEKTKNAFFHFYNQKNSNIISKFNHNFSEDFFEVYNISVPQKIKILETRPDFLTFSAKPQNRF